MITLVTFSVASFRATARKRQRWKYSKPPPQDQSGPTLEHRPEVNEPSVKDASSAEDNPGSAVHMELNIPPILCFCSESLPVPSTLDGEGLGWVSSDTHMHTHTLAHTCTHTYTCTCTHHTYVHSRAHTHMHMHTPHTCTYTCTYTCTHTHMPNAKEYILLC